MKLWIFILFCALEINSRETKTTQFGSLFYKSHIHCVKKRMCINSYESKYKVIKNKGSKVYKLAMELAEKLYIPSPKIDQLTGSWIDHLTRPYNITNVWKYAREIISPNSLVGERGKGLADILHAMRNSKIISAKKMTHTYGTQMKVLLTLEGGQKFIFKPNTSEIHNERYKTRRDYVNRQAPFEYPDRPEGEIASFYTSLLLDMKMIPIVTGRMISITKEILPFAQKFNSKTFSVKDNNTCFSFRSRNERVCDKNEEISGSLMMILSSKLKIMKDSNIWFTHIENPFYTESTDYCSNATEESFPGDEFTQLLNSIDTCIFDFLIQNSDRFQNITINKDFNSYILFDNGRSFENPFEDYLDILAPLLQCCRIRYSTYNRLLMFVSGGLSKAMRRLLSTDPLSPVVSDLHLKAMDRRLYFVLAAVEVCRKEKGNTIFV